MFKSTLSTILFLFILCWPLTLLAQKPPVVMVIYAEQPTFLPIYQNIYRTIEESLDAYVVSYRIREQDTVRSIVKQLERHNIQLYVPLGKTALNIINQINDKKTPVIASAISNPDFTHKTTHNLLFKPKLDFYFKRLKLIKPEINKIYIIPEQSELWLMPFLRDLAKLYDYELIEHGNLNLIEQSKKHLELMLSINAKKEAIWLSEKLDKAIFYEIVKLSWKRKVVLLSNSVGQVKRGALFCFFPDIDKVGIEIVKLSKEVISGEFKPGISLLNQAKSALNTRVAHHINANIKDLDQFNLLFPKPR